MPNSSNTTVVEPNGSKPTQWIVSNLSQVAEFFQSPRETIKNWRRDGMPGKKGEWDLSEITSWRLNQVRSNIPRDHRHSPALERYREERAKLAELDRREREGELVQLGAINSWLMRLALLIRQCGEQAERQYGSGARELIDDALSEYERELEASYSD